jgi:hypothetical protein
VNDLRYRAVLRLQGHLEENLSTVLTAKNCFTNLYTIIPVVQNTWRDIFMNPQARRLQTLSSKTATCKTGFLPQQPLAATVQPMEAFQRSIQQQEAAVATGTSPGQEQTVLAIQTSFPVTPWTWLTFV